MSEFQTTLNLKELCKNLRLKLEAAIKQQQDRIREQRKERVSMRYAGIGFMNAVFDLGQAIEMGQVKRGEPQLEQTLEEVNSKLLLIESSIADGITSIEDFVAYPDECFEYDSLKKGCFCRSCIEFFNKLFPNPGDGRYPWEDFNEDDLEEVILMRADSIGPVEPNDIPPGIPSSHWWWWSEGDRPDPQADSSGT